MEKLRWKLCVCCCCCLCCVCANVYTVNDWLIYIITFTLHFWEQKHCANAIWWIEWVFYFDSWLNVNTNDVVCKYYKRLLNTNFRMSSQNDRSNDHYLSRYNSIGNFYFTSMRLYDFLPFWRIQFYETELELMESQHSCIRSNSITNYQLKSLSSASSVRRYKHLIKRYWWNDEIDFLF